jgi:hypothetical protein
MNQPITRNFWSIHNSLLDTRSHVNTSLLPLLLRHRPCSNTDPKDKVYALLVLASTAANQRSHVDIQPDYDREHSVEEVLISTALRIIRTERNLDIFSVPRAATASNLKGLLSWVPDWTADELTSSLLIQDREVQRRCFFATLLSSEAEPKLKPDDSTVGPGLRGQLIDCVQEVGALFGKQITMSASELSNGRIRYIESLAGFYYSRAMNRLTLLSWDRLTDAHSGQLYLTHTGEKILDVFWQTFLAGSARTDDWKKERISWELILK